MVGNINIINYHLIEICFILIFLYINKLLSKIIFVQNKKTLFSLTREKEKETHHRETQSRFRHRRSHNSVVAPIITVSRTISAVVPTVSRTTISISAVPTLSYRSTPPWTRTSKFSLMLNMVSLLDQ